MTHSPLPGPKIILEGAPGSGKTTAILTAADAGLEVFVVFTDPGMAPIVKDKRVRWKYIPPSTGNWSGILDMATKVNTLSYESICKLSAVDRSKCTQFLEILHTMNDFKLNDISYGDVSTWSTGRMLFLDGLTGLSLQARQLHIGMRPTLHEGEWGVAMNTIGTFVNKLALDLWCPFCLIAHVEGEIDTFGMRKFLPSTLGKKLAPTLPVNFDDVILAKFAGGKFRWSTQDDQYDLKPRNLAISNDLPASFVPLFEEWKRKGGILEPPTQAAPPINQRTSA